MSYFSPCWNFSYCWQYRQFWYFYIFTFRFSNILRFWYFWNCLALLTLLTLLICLTFLHYDNQPETWWPENRPPLQHLRPHCPELNWDTILCSVMCQIVPAKFPTSLLLKFISLTISLLCGEVPTSVHCLLSTASAIYH